MCLTDEREEEEEAVEEEEEEVEHDHGTGRDWAGDDTEQGDTAQAAGPYNRVHVVHMQSCRGCSSPPPPTFRPSLKFFWSCLAGNE